MERAAHAALPPPLAGDRWYPLVKMTPAINVMGEVYVEVLRGIAPSGADQLTVTVVKARDLLPKV